MARYIGAVCKLCRREGGKLYLKGERCFSDKCSVTRRPYPPGQHGQGRFKMSEYGLGLLEGRLDNLMLRSGLASTRAQGRQLVRHNHVLVNGKRVNIPSYPLKAGDKIEVREKSRKIGFIQAALASAQGRPIPSWVEVDKANFSAVFRGAPPREELQDPAVREQYVVEYYSR